MFFTIVGYLLKLGPEAVTVYDAAKKVWSEIPETDKVAVENAFKAFVKEIEGIKI